VDGALVIAYFDNKSVIVLA